MTLIAPISVFFPYRVPMGPRMTSMRSMSIMASSKPGAMVSGTPSTYMPAETVSAVAGAEMPRMLGAHMADMPLAIMFMLGT